MDQKLLAQLFAEFREAQGQALAILTQALCQQVDPAKLTDDLRKQIDAAKQLPSTSSLAIGMATHAMAAAEAEKALQSKRPSEGPHPNRQS